MKNPENYADKVLETGENVLGYPGISWNLTYFLVGTLIWFFIMILVVTRF